MNATASLIGTSAVTFVATNLDDLFILTLLFAKRVPSQRIVVGQYLGFAAILVLSCAALSLTFVIPLRWVRLMGVFPLFLGLKALADMRGRVSGKPQDQVQRTLGIATLTLANGADNVGVYVPFFRINSEHLVVIVLSYGILVAVWCYLGHLLGRHPLVLQGVDKVGRWAVPSVLITLGIWILVK